VSGLVVGPLPIPLTSNDDNSLIIKEAYVGTSVFHFNPLKKEWVSVVGNMDDLYRFAVIACREKNWKLIFFFHTSKHRTEMAPLSAEELVAVLIRFCGILGFNPNPPNLRTYDHLKLAFYLQKLMSQTFSTPSIRFFLI